MFPFLETARRVVHFKILEKLSEGGMGDVYIAYDEKLKRNVVLKFLKSDLNFNEAAKERFKREAYVLSNLEHPNICRIYDFIEEGGKSILVLELIKGKNLREILKEKPNWNLKIKIAIQICDVLRIVHSKGIIHRDLKPANILITDDGTIKVLDFGLAGIVRDEEIKAKRKKEEIEIEGTDEEKTYVLDPFFDSNDGFKTKAGTIMGTLQYMSPEQARGEKITSSSDIYSFGLILQELFTGKPALECGESLEETLKNAQKGKTYPAEGIDKDLKILIERMKQINPLARPAAEDIFEKLKWISQKPKRKIKKLSFLTAAFFITIFAISMVFFNIKISNEKKKTQFEEKLSKYVSEFLIGIFEASDPYKSKGEEVTAREILEDAIKKVKYEFKGDPKLKMRLEETVGVIYLKLGSLDKAKPFLLSALESSKKLYGERDERYANSLWNLGYLYKIKEDFNRAEKFYTDALKIHKNSKGKDSIEVAKILNDLGELYREKGDYKKAETYLKDSLKIIQKTLGYYNENATTFLNNLAILYELKKEYEKAEQIYKKILLIDEKILGKNHPYFAIDIVNLADLYRKQEKLDEAEKLLLKAIEIDEKVFGRNHPTVATDLNNLAAVYYEKKDFEKAEFYYKDAMEIWEKAFGSQHTMVGLAKRNIGLLYFEKGNYWEAEKLYREALQILEKALPQDHPYVEKARKNLSELYDKMKK